MRVKFIFPYFGPSDPYNRGDGRAISGVLYSPGIHEVPDGLPLPSSAVIVDASNKPLPKPARGMRLADMDMDRAAADEVKRVTEAAAEQYTKNEETRKKRSRGRPRKYA